ncbi:DUF3788 family protein [Demequina sp.]|uniref:DUF3788 family protein n=1 Tax=Demequina sp. TaxID=2050685 RepID=UPI0025BA11FA|nr:DUF3788 family protein [Demequina sp.]
MGSAFKEASIEPTDARIREALGSSADVWAQAVALFEDASASVSWRYYRDGGWLARASRGKTTVAWLAVEEDLLKIAFYFAQRHREVLTDSEAIPHELQERIAVEPMMGKVLPVSIEVRDSTDLARVASVLAIKLSAK